MAAKTPSAIGASSIVGDPDLMIPHYTEATTDTPTAIIPAFGLRHRTFYFDDIDTDDTWASGIAQIVSLAWSPETATTSCNVSISSFAAGTVALKGSTTDVKGTLHVWTRS